MPFPIVLVLSGTYPENWVWGFWIWGDFGFGGFEFGGFWISRVLDFEGFGFGGFPVEFWHKYFNAVLGYFKIGGVEPG